MTNLKRLLVSGLMLAGCSHTDRQTTPPAAALAPDTAPAWPPIRYDTIGSMVRAIDGNDTITYPVGCENDLSPTCGQERGR